MSKAREYHDLVSRLGKCWLRGARASEMADDITRAEELHNSFTREDHEELRRIVENLRSDES